MTHHWRYFTLSDFRPGLFEVGDPMSFPPNALTELTDAYPLPEGGLHPFLDFTTFSNAGIGANERPIGLFTRGGIPLRSGAPGDASDRYLVTYSSTDFRPRLYRWDETAVVPPTAWTLLATFAVAAGNNNFPAASTFTTYTLSAGPTTHVYFTLAYVGADDGLWRIEYAAGATAKISSDVNYITSYQARLLGTKGDTLRWTDPGTETFAAPNTLPVEPHLPLSNNVALIPFAPSNLLVGKEGQAFYMIQGEIGQPIVRQMSIAHYASNRQIPALTDDGIAFMVDRDGVYLTGSGESFTPISPQITPTNIVGRGPAIPGGPSVPDVTLGTMAYARHFLFTPYGYVFDHRTKAWFKTSAWTAAKQMHFDRHVDYNQLFLAEPSGSTTALKIGTIADYTSRTSSWSFTTAPLTIDGRHAEIAEVELHVRTFASTDFTITVSRYPSGPATTKTVTVPAATNDVVRIPIRTHPAEFFTVRLQAAATGGADGPILRSMRLGAVARYRVRTLA